MKGLVILRFCDGDVFPFGLAVNSNSGPSFIKLDLSLVMKENLSSGFPTRSDTNRAIQPHKMTRGLKFQIKQVDGVYYLCIENKGADLLCCVFAYAKSRFYQDAAHLS